MRKRKIAPGTQNIRASTGLELQVMMPVVNAPFRLYYAYNPLIVQTVPAAADCRRPLHVPEPGHVPQLGGDSLDELLRSLRSGRCSVSPSDGRSNDSATAADGRRATIENSRSFI